MQPVKRNNNTNVMNSRRIVEKALHDSLEANVQFLKYHCGCRKQR